MGLMKGVGIGNGFAIGKALLLLDEETVVLDDALESASPEEEIARLEDAIEKAKEEVLEIKSQVQGKIGEEHAFIFDTHVMFLEDKGLQRETIAYIKEKRCTAQWAFSQVLLKILKEFSSLGDSYFMERSKDLEDVGKRLLRILLGGSEMSYRSLQDQIIVIGHEFGPSNITRFDTPQIVGFATDMGGQTTHTAIIAKALGIPAVLGLHEITKTVQSGDTVVLDSINGHVYINPDEATLEKYQKLSDSYLAEEASYAKEVESPTITIDGREITLQANIELPHEVDNALRNGAQGIGLYRTEFLFLQFDPRLPSEDDHYQVYCEIAEKMQGREVTIRTLDLGGEKFFHRTFVREKELNPVMGLRGVRLCLARKDIFRVQLRALLRAAKKYPNIRIMFPLITGLKEFRQVQRFLEEVKKDLAAIEAEYEPNPTIGVMIEVPSAAMIADLLAKEVDFFSIGTNDLIQYFLAIDRGNDDVSYLYDPFHPGVVRVLKQVIDAAKHAGIDVSCCGEVASNPLSALLLMQLGLTKLSMNPSSVPTISHLVRALDVSAITVDMNDPCLGPTGAETKRHYVQMLRQHLNEKDFDHLLGSMASQEDDDPEPPNVEAPGS